MVEIEEKSNLAIKIIAAVLIVLVIVGIILLGVFNKPKPHDNLPEEYFGRYDLTEISGVNGVTVESYEYNYIELKSDGRYVIANKYKKKKTEQKGVWYVEERKVYFESSRFLGFVKTTDSGNISGDTITMTVENDANRITLTLTKKA